MNVARARIIAAPRATAVAGRRVPREVLDAKQQARAILDEAAQQAARIRERALLEGQAEGAAAVAARFVERAADDARSAERALDRTVELAVLLAERLLGEALAVAPERVAAIARQALREARGAHAVTIAAHPEDAALLARDLEALGLPDGVVRIEPDVGRARGSLRLSTEAGVLDGELAPQLERLCKKLRESLSP
jgi:flagellar biosynthesis/type III secretory pathway protein FliH